MPTRLPAANWAQARPSQRSTKAFDLSCAAIGAAAAGLAAFIDVFCYDRSGALLVLLMAGVLIALLMRRVSRRAAGSPTARTPASDRQPFE